MIVFNPSCRKSADEFRDKVLMELQLHQNPVVEVPSEASNNHITYAFGSLMKSKHVTQHHVMQNLTVTGDKKSLAVGVMNGVYLLG